MFGSGLPVVGTEEQMACDLCPRSLDRGRPRWVLAFGHGEMRLGLSKENSAATVSAVADFLFARK